MEGGETHVRMLRLATNSVGLRLCLPTDQTYDELTTGPCLRLSVPSPGPCHRVNLHVPMLHCLAPLGLLVSCGTAALPYRHGPCLGLPYHHIGAGLCDLELNSQHPLELRPALLLGSAPRHHASLVAAVDRARDALRPPPPVVARYLATRAPDAYAAAPESNFRGASPPLLNHDLHAIDADTRSSASRAA